MEKFFDGIGRDTVLKFLYCAGTSVRESEVLPDGKADNEEKSYTRLTKETFADFLTKVQSHDSLGKTTLDGKIDLSDLLLPKSIDRPSINFLSLLAKAGNIELLESLLIDETAFAESVFIDMTRPNPNGYSPLMYAVMHPKALEMFEIFLKASVRREINLKLGQKTTLRGFTVLHLASEFGRVGVVEHLVESCGAKLYSRDIKGCTPFFCRCG